MKYRQPIIIWLGLLALLALTVGLNVLMAGPWRPLLHYLIATVMAALLMVFFMRLRASDGLIRLFAVGGVLWLGLLIVITLSEVLTR